VPLQRLDLDQIRQDLGALVRQLARAEIDPVQVIRRLDVLADGGQALVANRAPLQRQHLQRLVRAEPLGHVGQLLDAQGNVVELQVAERVRNGQALLKAATQLFDPLFAPDRGRLLQFSKALDQTAGFYSTRRNLANETLILNTQKSLLPSLSPCGL